VTPETGKKEREKSTVWGLYFHSDLTCVLMWIPCIEAEEMGEMKKKRGGGEACRYRVTGCVRN
jgi:hypothetical protein